MMGADMKAQAAKEAWIEDAKERLTDNERVIRSQAERIAELSLALDRLRNVLMKGLAATAGVADLHAEDVSIVFTEHAAKEKKVRRTGKVGRNV